MDPFELSEITDDDEAPPVGRSPYTVITMNGAKFYVWTSQNLQPGAIIYINGQMHIVTNDKLSTGDSNEVS